MLQHYKGMKHKPHMVYVKDHAGNAWIDALTAHYVKSGGFETPMGHGIAAFSEMKAAHEKGMPMTLDEALGMLGGGMHEMKEHNKMKMH
jgi:nitrous oxide reductase accessory protein NosL